MVQTFHKYLLKEYQPVIINFLTILYPELCYETRDQIQKHSRDFAETTKNMNTKWIVINESHCHFIIEVTKGTLSSGYLNVDGELQLCATNEVYKQVVPTCGKK